jgi:hypothetical protein
VCTRAIALALIAFAPAAAAEVTATRLDGTAIVGELSQWNAEHAFVTTSGGEQRLAADELLSIAWQSASQKPGSQTTAGHVELIDGTLIPIDDITVSSTKVATTLPAALPTDERSLTLARNELAAVRLQPLEGATLEQWQELRDTDFAGDVLALLKRDGKSLDYVEGVVGDVSATHIEFKLEGDPLRIEREKVAGFIYYRRHDGADSEPRCIVHGRSGLLAIVARAELADGLVQLETVAGVEFNWPLDDIHLADYSAGKLVYLSDIEPASERWTPLVGLPPDATLATEYGRPRRNQSAYGGPLTLRPDDSITPSHEARRRIYGKGLALRSRTELIYRLPTGFQRFAAFAGIDPLASTSGHVRLEIYGDDRLLLEDDLAGDEPPRSIELDISGIKRLRILVDYGRNLDTGDWLNLCDARIIK